MFLLKSCPKCVGDMYVSREEPEVPEVYCVQCGFRTYGEPQLVVKATDRRSEPVLAQVA